MKYFFRKIGFSKSMEQEENARRKHNYLPFIIEMLKMVAKKGKLKDLVETAKEKQAARIKAKEDRKKEKEKEEKK